MSRWATCVNWIEAHSRWNQLRELGNSNLVKVSVLMPAFGYMLLLNDQVHQFLTIRYDGWLLQYLPVWRIWFLFYGSFALAAATILYLSFCPAEVKRYGSAFEMADREAEHQLNLGQSEAVAAGIQKILGSSSHRELALYPETRPNLKRSPHGMLDPKALIQSFLIFQWTIQNMRRPGMRCVIFLCFGVGLTLVAIPAIVTLLQVSWLPVRAGLAALW